MRIVPRFALATLAALALCGAPASPARADGVDLAAVKATLEREIARRMASDGLPSVSIALVRGDEVVWKAAFGTSNVWAKTPAAPDTIYSTGSTWKTATATALMQLVEQGKAKLDDPVNPLLGDRPVKQPAGSKPITLRHLLTHTSGLPTSGYTVPVWDRSLPPALDDAVAHLTATTAPGVAVVYSNVGFALVGRLASSLAGVPYTDLMQKGVIDPLEMKATTFVPSAATVERMAIPYSKTATGVAPLRQVRFDVVPAGDVYSTPEDLSHLLIAHLNGGVFRGKRILSEASAEEMHRRQFFQDRGTTGFGLAFVVDESGGHRLIGHDGLVPGLTAQMLGDLDAKVGVVLMSNLAEGNKALSYLARAAVRLMRGETWTPFDPAVARRDPVPAGWPALAGTYLSSRVGPIVVALEGKALSLSIQGSKGWLVPGEGDVFTARSDDWVEALPVAFVRDATGAVTGVQGASGEVAPRTKGDVATTMDLSLPPVGEPVGEWEGTVKLGSMRVDFALRVRREGKDLVGDVDVPAQGLSKSPLDHVLHHGKRLHLEHGQASARAITEGELEGDVFRGTMKMGVFPPLPLEAYRVGSEPAKAARAAREAEKAAAASAPPPKGGAFVGRWEGEIEVGLQKLGFVVEATSDTAATMDIPKQGLSKAALENVRRDGAKVIFELPSPIGRAVWTGAIDGDVIRGTMAQGPNTLPFELRRK